MSRNILILLQKKSQRWNMRGLMRLRTSRSQETNNNSYLKSHPRHSVKKTSHFRCQLHTNPKQEETAVEASDYESTTDTPTDTDSDRDLCPRSRNIRGEPPRNPPTQVAQQLVGEQHVGAQLHAPIPRCKCPENNEAADIFPLCLTLE